MLLLLLAGLAGWTALAGGRSGPQLALLACAAGAYVLGRLLAATTWSRALLGAAVAGGVVGAVLLAEDGLSGAALAGPVGYGNANGALCTLGAGAALVAVWAPRVWWLRPVGLAGAGVLTWLAWQTGSAAATAGCAALVLAALLVLGLPRIVGRLPWAAAGLVLLALVGTLLLAGGVLEGGAAGAVLSERRVVLWSEALDLARAEPVLGVGIGGFAGQAPTAVADRDARWAHSAWLQQAAETGLPGAALLVLLGVVAVVGVGRAGRSASAALAGLAVAAVLAQASMDYVLHFGAVTVLAALLSGVAGTPDVHLAHSPSRASV